MVMLYNRARRQANQSYAFEDREAVCRYYAVQATRTAANGGPCVADVTTAEISRIAIENFPPNLISETRRLNEIAWHVVGRIAKAANHKKILIAVPAAKSKNSIRVVDCDNFDVSRS